MLFAPRISPRLLAALDRLARSQLTPAEITRSLGAEASRRGLPRPSYERVRVLVQEMRLAQRRRVQHVFRLSVGMSLWADVHTAGMPSRLAQLPLLPPRMLPLRRTLGAARNSLLRARMPVHV